MTDRFTVRAVVLSLALYAVVALVLTAWLLHDGTAPDGVAVVSGSGGVALGGLAALLARTSVDPAPLELPPPAPVAAAPPAGVVAGSATGAPAQ